tara:strand:+ start:12 stop:1451 length:1440 start_codon:yes stop_codon:yes gene_type:complete
MLGKIRNFSSSIFAKIFLFIVAIPFVFWGMGDLFRGGSLNTIAKIGKDKISVNEFVDYVNLNTSANDNLDSAKVEKLLSGFIGQKVIEKEIDNLNIIVSDKSLSKIIKNEKLFKKEDKFSRVEYEKFLVTNSLSAIGFEKNMSNQIKKQLLFDFIGGGIIPTNFLVNVDFDKINQKRNIEIIKLDNVIKKKIKLTDNEIKSYYDKNKENYNDIYKTVKILEINPENLTGEKEFSNLFFERIDEIDDLIIEGEKLIFLQNKFNLNIPNEFTLNKDGKNKNDIVEKNISKEIIDSIFSSNESNLTFLITDQSKYFIIEIDNIENVQKKINNAFVKKDILINLAKKKKRKFISLLIDKIGKKEFKKQEFNKFSADENVNIEKVSIENLNDDKILKKNLVKQIYSYPEGQVIVVAEIGLTESYLVYINKIENTSIEKTSENYKKYYNLSKVRIASSIYNTYDAYLRNKYEIDINRNALEKIKN